mgnify:CR=1 FL=1
MRNNLIPPFILRETGIEVCNTPKIHKSDPMVQDHLIHFVETGFRIPLQLWGVFSYFNTSKPSTKMMIECEEIYLLTPKYWNPHVDVYGDNEKGMLDCKGEMVPRERRQQVFLSDVTVKRFLKCRSV